MKYLNEFRDAQLAKSILAKIESTVSQPWSVMEVCGGQTHSLVKNGLLDLLSPQITLVHGPGCPVCVTPIGMIDQAIDLSLRPDTILCSFGDMIRVPGSNGSLLTAKANGATIKIVYSPLEAVKIAEENPNKEVVFFAVGFETTAPANALSAIHASQKGLKNYSLLTSHVLVPPAMEAILSEEDSLIQGFLAAGHVCTVMGSEEYVPLAAKYKVPIVITGFEPIDLLVGLSAVIDQLEEGKFEVENQYKRVVKDEGNKIAKKTIFEVFEVSEREWRGIGEIPDSGYKMKSSYSDFDATKKFKIESSPVSKDDGLCIAGEILKGQKKPFECTQFGKACNPANPLGAPMVSSEGACAAYYHYSNHEVA